MPAPIAVFGIDARRDPVAAKRVIAWVSDEPMVYDRLTPVEYLQFVAGLWQMPAARRKRAPASSSAGWAWRRTPTNAAAASPRACCRRLPWPAPWCTTRSLIILDEPLTGLDAGSARQVKDVLLGKVRDGVTVIMTTHILEVAERMAERIGVIAQGRLIAEGTLEELRGAGPTWRQQPRGHLPRPRRRERDEACRRMIAATDIASPGSPRHELGLFWRDWIGMMTAGQRDPRHVARHRVAWSRSFCCI